MTKTGNNQSLVWQRRKIFSGCGVIEELSGYERETKRSNGIDLYSLLLFSYYYSRKR